MAGKPNRAGLGKGLGALISEAAVNEEAGIMQLNIQKISRNQNQPRKVFDKEAISELAASIAEHGIIQPLIVTKKDEGYMIVAGERRYRAALQAGLSEVPVIVREYSDEELMQTALIENLQREDLNAIEEAGAYKSLIDNFGYTQEELAKKLGVSRTAIANCLRLLNLSDDIQQLVGENRLSAGHARAVLSLENDEKKSEFARYIVENALSVREAEKAAKTYAGSVKKVSSQIKTKKETNTSNRDIHLTALENELCEAFATKVVIEKKEQGGVIKIEYYDNDDLERILEKIEK